jgi:hypothetical protein
MTIGRHRVRMIEKKGKVEHLHYLRAFPLPRRESCAVDSPALSLRTVTSVPSSSLAKPLIIDPRISKNCVLKGAARTRRRS